MTWTVIDATTHDMAVHAILVPGGEMGRVLYFGGYSVNDTHLYDVKTEQNVKTFSSDESPHNKTLNPFRYDIFCCGHAYLADGRILIAGGELNANSITGLNIALPAGESVHQHGGMQFGGERQAAQFHPLSEKWELAGTMRLDPAGNEYSGGRWYPTLTTLADGKILAVGGHPDRNENYTRDGKARHSNNAPERYDPSTDSWTLLASDPPTDDQITAPFSQEKTYWDYQRPHLLPNGKVFFASEVRFGGGSCSQRPFHLTEGQNQQEILILANPANFGHVHVTQRHGFRLRCGDLNTMGLPYPRKIQAHPHLTDAEELAGLAELAGRAHRDNF